MTFLVAIVLVAPAWTLAHHSFNATYLEGQRLTIDGDIVRWIYRNPHAELVVAVRDGRAVEEWIVEWDAALHLRRSGVTAETLAAGQRVVVSGSPGRRAAARRLRLRTIVRPADGWSWSSSNR